MKAVLDLPVAAGQPQQRFGLAFGFVGRETRQVVVVLDYRIAPALNGLAGRANAKNLAQPRPSPAAPFRAVAIGARGVIDPEFMGYDFASF